jgi:hypothetical protein
MKRTGRYTMKRITCRKDSLDWIAGLGIENFTGFGALLPGRTQEVRKIVDAIEAKLPEKAYPYLAAYDRAEREILVQKGEEARIIKIGRN